MVSESDNWKFAFYWMLFLVVILFVLVSVQMAYIDNLQACSMLCDLRGPLG